MPFRAVRPVSFSLDDSKGLALFGVVAAVWGGAMRLFDARERLRLDRLDV